MNKKQYYSSLAMLGCLFFVFGLVTWVNSILVPYFKDPPFLHYHDPVTHTINNIYIMGNKKI